MAACIEREKFSPKVNTVLPMRICVVKEQFHEHAFSPEVKQRLTNNFIQKSHDYFESSPKCIMIFKYLCDNFELQVHL